ncbi:MAG: DUF1667 domain-containing protein [Clostridia bacterium]|nr:DUF1667 domain-containing protein [Clostridia bacterium]
MEMTCIVCPNGCLLKVEMKGEELIVEGAKCKRGNDYARAELTAPKRSLTSTVRTVFEDMPVLPVRTAGEIDKGAIFEVMTEINKVTVKHRVRRGEVIIPNVIGSGIDIISTSDMIRGGKNGKGTSIID